ncbi:UNVERIFIED_CONTAM: hypothetical protein Sradi_1740400 [Sesamum radiatum]|uniref:Uncharacterized protein n=1 Tax=Sesamum radiatum TaxID=300843 RepID=A0AAW2TUB5_SESRA
MKASKIVHESGYKKYQSPYTRGLLTNLSTLYLGLGFLRETYRIFLHQLKGVFLKNFLLNSTALNLVGYGPHLYLRLA